jgi:fluoride exporter
MWKPIVAISLAVSLGALLRWWLGARLNSSFSSMPPRTLVANLAGGYIVGVVTALFTSVSAVTPE